MNNGTLSLVTPPSAELMSLDEIKAHLRVDDTDEDGLIVGKLIAARMMAEAWTSRAFITQTWDWFLPCWPSDEYGGTFFVPMPPLQTVTHIKYLDTGWIEQTLDPSAYTVIAPAGPRASFGRIFPSQGSDWPGFGVQEDAIRIRFVAGWTGPEKVPETIRSAVKLIVGDLYENREAQIADARAIIQANRTVDALLLNHMAYISGMRAA